MGFTNLGAPWVASSGMLGGGL